MSVKQCPINPILLFGIIIILFLASIALMVKGYRPAQNPSASSPTASVSATLGDAQTKEGCDLKGGTWQKWGLIGAEYCQIPAADANKSCGSGSECSLGKCISESNQTDGKCQTYKNTYGCINYIENGQVESSVCID